MVTSLERTSLVCAAQTGDLAATERLLAVCQADARRYARKHCHASDIDDAVQETLLVISRKVRGLKAAAAFSSWRFTVIRRECRKIGKAMLGGPTLEDEAETLIAHRPNEQLRIDLARALDSLPAHYLEVILMRDFEELTISEMAERLREPPGAIKSRLRRARQLVREYLILPEERTGEMPGR